MKPIKIFIQVIIFSLALSLLSCSKPVIPISNTLELGLGSKYSSYVKLLNKSASGDSDALHEFLLIDYLSDGSGYDHGSVIVELIKKIGDNSFSTALGKLDEKQLNNVKDYVKAGLDGPGDMGSHLPKEYPLTFKLLGITAEYLK
jgi:hypothetical protein